MKRTLITLLTIASLFTTLLAQEQEKLKLAFAGDIMMGTNYPTAAYLMPDNGVELYKDVTSIIKNSDCAFANLEGVLLDKGGTPKKCGNPKHCYAFRTPFAYV